MRTTQSSKNTKSPGFTRQSLAISICCSLLAPMSPIALAKSIRSEHDQSVAVQITEPAKIQLAILLDTSGSMDGLIDQTRNQIWQVVNEFASAKKNGVTPILEVALFEYGNSGNAKSEGYIRELSKFTRELDRVSEGLFSLTTNGGSEYCGYAIKTAVNNLQWSHSSGDIKSIFIAGNEPFTQGPVNYKEAIKLAGKQGISVNTIHAGGHEAGIQSGWQSGAILAGGDYMSIDANQQVVHIIAPQDKQIAELNNQLNKTYSPYGSMGTINARRQQEQDAQSSGISAGLLAKRAKSKSSSYYSNATWDLVDALKEGKVEQADLAIMEAEALPAPMKNMSASEKKDFVQGKALERNRIKQEISILGKSREAYVAEKLLEQDSAAPSMSDALTKAIKKQARKKDFVLNP